MALRNLIVALVAVILTATPAFARGGGGGGHAGGGGFHGGGGFRGGGGFHGGGAFRGGSGFHGRARFDRFHRFGFFGDFWIRGACRRLRFRSLLLGSLLVPSTVPGLYLRSTTCDPTGARRVRAAGGLTRDNVLVLLCRDQWVLPIHTAVSRRLAKGSDDSD